MLHNTELELKAAGMKTFLPVFLVSLLLSLISAIFSSNAFFLISVNCLLVLIPYHYLKRSANQAKAVNQTFTANAEGDLCLEISMAAAKLGRLKGTQWCTRNLAVLRYQLAGKVGYLVILKFQQRPEQFRRLSVWLRHNSRNEGRQTL